MFLAIARPRPVPARRVVKYGSKMRGRSSSAMPLPVSRIVTATRRSPVVCVISVTRRRAGRRLRSRDAALVSRLTSTVRSRSLSVTSSGSAGARLERHRPVGRGRRRRPGPRRGRRALMSVGAGSKRIGRATSSTSLTRLFSRSISSSMSVAASRTSAAVAPSRASVRSAPLMIISGLRTSCAMTVDSRPSDDSRSRWPASRWKRAIESVSVLNVVASMCASSSSQPPCRLVGDLPGEVAGRGDLPHVIGDRRQRPRDGARHAVADDDGQQRGAERDAGQRRLDGAQRTHALAARAHDDRRRIGRAAAGAERLRDARRIPRRRSRCAWRPWPASSGASASARARSERRRPHDAVHRERDVGAGQRLELRGPPIVEQVADAERRRGFRTIEAERDRHAHDFEHAARVRPERRRHLAVGERQAGRPAAGCAGDFADERQLLAARAR